MLERALVAERVRQSQQGKGRPIVSTDFNGHKFVAVGKTLHWSNNWKTFPDFLDDYLKRVLTVEWGNAELAKPQEERHPLIQWYVKVRKYRAAHSTKIGTISSYEINGAVACYVCIAYGLYLLQHNIELQERLVNRLKNPGNFQGAYYEILIASAFIRAGFDLILEDESDGSAKHCEFAAVSKTSGRRYWIEAKMRAVAGFLGRHERDGATTKRSTVLSKLTRHLNQALAKPAPQERMIFIDLNAEIAENSSSENPPSFAAEAVEHLEDYERKRLKSGEKAYVFVTSIAFHRDLDGPPRSIAIPFGLGIPGFNRDRTARLYEIYLEEKRHEDAYRVAEELEKLLVLPQTFDGALPSATFDNELSPVEIGRTYQFTDADGLVGTVKEAIVVESESAVYVIVETDDKMNHILREDITPSQLHDYKLNPDEYFGARKRAPRTARTPYELFCFFMDTYKDVEINDLPGLTEDIIRTFDEISDEEKRAYYCEYLVSCSGVFEVVDGVFIPHGKSARPAETGERS